MVSKKYFVGLVTTMMMSCTQSFVDQQTINQDTQQPLQEIMQEKNIAQNTHNLSTINEHHIQFSQGMLLMKNSPYELNLDSMNNAKNTKELYEIVTGLPFNNFSSLHNETRFLKFIDMNETDSLSLQKINDAYNKIGDVQLEWTGIEITNNTLANIYK